MQFFSQEAKQASCNTTRIHTTKDSTVLSSEITSLLLKTYCPLNENQKNTPFSSKGFKDSCGLKFGRIGSQTNTGRFCKDNVCNNFEASLVSFENVPIRAYL